ncbi:hypothetical protein DER44DRAFT_751783 [Fusarium oxysporum]|nr:hypothetical protein DER44DRAFT_751783 [Fusarium oxysporum]
MGIKFISRTPALALVVDQPSWRISRGAASAIVRPSTSAGSPVSGTIMLPISTPPVMDGDNMKSVSASVRFRTGSDATVTNFRVHDGEFTIHNEAVNLSQPTLQDRPLSLPDQQVRRAIVVSLQVRFSGTPADDFIELVFAEVTFDNI